MGVAAAARSYSAGRPRALRRHQPRRSLGDDRASLRRALEPVLEAAVRVAAGRRADRLQRRRSAGGVGLRHHQPRGAADARASTIFVPRSTSRDGARSSGRSGATSRPSWPWSASRSIARSCRSSTRARRAPGRGAKRPLGLQPVTIHGARVFVLPNPSGRNANFSYAEMLAAFRALSYELLPT